MVKPKLPEQKVRSEQTPKLPTHHLVKVERHPRKGKVVVEKVREHSGGARSEQVRGSERRYPREGTKKPTVNQVVVLLKKRPHVKLVHTLYSAVKESTDLQAGGDGGNGLSPHERPNRRSIPYAPCVNRPVCAKASNRANAGSNESAPS
nr:hypothetical protein MACL_00000003 [Theileria orientalis]